MPWLQKAGAAPFVNSFFLFQNLWNSLDLFKFAASEVVILVVKCYGIFQVPRRAWFANTLTKKASVDMLVYLLVSKAASDLC